MNLEQKTFGRRNFLKGVIVGVIVTIATIGGGMTALKTLGYQTYEGNIDGVKVSYWQKWKSCRKLIIEEQNGMKTVMYDKRDDNILGNNFHDFIEMTYPKGIEVRYRASTIRVKDREGERIFNGKLERDLEVVTASGEKETIKLRPSNEIFSDYTKLFNQYRERIINK